MLQHGTSTARFNIYYGEGRDTYDVSGRTAHESIFNLNDGRYRCPSSQQGYSRFSTWTRGLAWAILGYAEQLEFLSSGTLKSPSGQTTPQNKTIFLRATKATPDFYLQNCCTDGIPIWDTEAPNVHRLGNYLQKPSDPYNGWEPVDSSAAVIAAQGFLRLGRHLEAHGEKKRGSTYWQAGLSIAATLLQEPYLSANRKHQGLLLHSIYHRPNGWDKISPGQKIPNGESSMWGDYHLRELGLYLLREAKLEPYLCFFANTA